MLTAATGRPYDIEPDEIVGSRDSQYPRLVLEDHGITGIINGCSDIEAASDAALEATATLYPPLVCTAEGLYGGVVIPVIQN